MTLAANFPRQTGILGQNCRRSRVKNDENILNQLFTEELRVQIMPVASVG